MRQAKYAGIVALVLSTGCNTWIGPIFGQGSCPAQGQAAPPYQTPAPVVAQSGVSSPIPIPSQAEHDFSQTYWRFMVGPASHITYTVDSEPVGRAMESWMVDIYLARGPMTPTEELRLLYNIDSNSNRVIEREEVFEGDRFKFQRPQIRSRHYEELGQNGQQHAQYQRAPYRNRNSGGR